MSIYTYAALAVYALLVVAIPLLGVRGVAHHFN